MYPTLFQTIQNIQGQILWVNQKRPPTFQRYLGNRTARCSVCGRGENSCSGSSCVSLAVDVETKATRINMRSVSCLVTTMRNPYHYIAILLTRQAARTYEKLQASFWKASTGPQAMWEENPAGSSCWREQRGGERERRERESEQAREIEGWDSQKGR